MGQHGWFDLTSPEEVNKIRLGMGQLDLLNVYTGLEYSSRVGRPSHLPQPCGCAFPTPYLWLGYF